jgi:hypothetical protein
MKKSPRKSPNAESKTVRMFVTDDPMLKTLEDNAELRQALTRKMLQQQASKAQTLTKADES